MSFRGQDWKDVMWPKGALQATQAAPKRKNHAKRSK